MADKTEDAGTQESKEKKESGKFVEENDDPVLAEMRKMTLGKDKTGNSESSKTSDEKERKEPQEGEKEASLEEKEGSKQSEEKKKKTREEPQLDGEDSIDQNDIGDSSDDEDKEETGGSETEAEESEPDDEETEDDLFIPEISSVTAGNKESDNFNTKYEANVRSENGEMSLYTFCPQCEEHIFITYQRDLIESADSYPVHICWIHGNPFHGLLVRIDKNFVSRGERVVHLEFDAKLAQYYGG